MAAIRVVVADDHPVTLSGLRADLGDAFEVVGEAADATNAIAAIRATAPDVAAIDLRMPNGGGLAVARACGELTKIVMLTAHDAERDVLDAVASGAVGYILKTATAEELRDALRRAAAGQPVFSAALAGLVMGEFRRLARAAGADPLTSREREVVTHVARGASYKQVGAALGISPKTVDNHVRNLLAKLRLSRKDELIRYAVDHDLT
jgi:DNA-binding NarL/FixJ family response regulator